METQRGAKLKEHVRLKKKITKGNVMFEIRKTVNGKEMRDVILVKKKKNSGV